MTASAFGNGLEKSSSQAFYLFTPSLRHPGTLASALFSRLKSEYNHLVKVKTSITLPEDLLQAIDQTDPNRSTFIEKAARQYLAALAKSRRDAQDAEILNACAQSLNREAVDVLEYQDLA